MKKLFTVFLFAEILCGTNIFSQTGWFSQMSGTTNNLNSIYFLNDNIGYAVGDAGTLIMTTDGGNNWNTAIFPYALRSLSFPASSRGYSVGDNGEMLKSTNSGNFWASQISGTSSNLKSFYSPSENIGDVVGEGGVILMTTTGGTVIPVELTSFTALQNRDEVILKWQTATETNNKGFEIERYALSATRKEWVKIGFVNGLGTTSEKHDYSFSDKNLNSGENSYRLKQIDFDGSYHYSNVVDVLFNAQPVGYSLEQNYPNPFNPTTTIKYSLPFDSYVKIVVYNSIRREVKVLEDGNQSSGYHDVVFNAAGLSSGVYFYRLQAGNFVQCKKFVLMK